MPDFTNPWMIAFLVLLVGGIVLSYLINYKKDKKELTQPAALTNARDIQLAAYERLTLLADRISLPNLVGRLNDSSLNAREMQFVLGNTLRQEFDHNITQQIYVSPEAWQAVRNLKDTNLLAINEIAAMLPMQANALDLNKQILEYTMRHPKGNMHTLVQEVLSYEAKKIM
jgi:hypothetical protein